MRLLLLVFVVVVVDFTFRLWVRPSNDGLKLHLGAVKYLEASFLSSNADTGFINDIVPNDLSQQYGIIDDWPPTQMLDALLPRVSTPREDFRHRRFIVCACNANYLSFVYNFVNSLVALNVSNFVVVPLDDSAYHKLRRVYPKHTLPLLPGYASGPKGKTEYGSEGFKKLTATRPVFLRHFLEKGYAVLYNDIDMVWQHNAWDAIDERNDTFENATTAMIWLDGKPMYWCTCIMYLLPTLDNISILNQWEAEIRTGKYDDDQDAFDPVASRLNLPENGGATATGFTLFKNDHQFPAGNMYFNESTPVKEKAVIIHTNWVMGTRSKIMRFKKAGLWKPTPHKLYD